jgi:type 1 fimbria pilin
MNTKMTAIALTTISLLFSTAALADTASDGTVHITGTILQNACTVKTASVEVPLKDQYASIFTAAGQVQSNKAFTIDLENCDPSVYKNIQARFEGTVDNYGNTVLANTAGSASGIGVQILDSANNALAFNDESAWSTQSTLADGQTDISLPFSAQFIATNSSVTAGSVDATATFYLQYN